MKITFILPGIGLSGGVKAVFEFANHLEKLGHTVNIIHPLVPLSLSLKGKIRGTIGNLIRGKNPSWFVLKAKLVRVPILSEKYIPNADIIVATWWQTAYIVNKLNAKKGKKFYLVQHYETWGGPEREVENSYKLGLKIIVNSTWLKNLLLDKLDVKSEALIFHAPDHEQFYPEKIIKEDKNTFRILMPYREELWKGALDGFKAFKIIEKAKPNAKLVIFGPKPKNDHLLEGVEFHNFPVKDKLRKVYNSCDLFLFPSIFEGFGMPPMEAMACNLPLVATRVGAVPDYTISGETALVSEPGDAPSLAKNAIKLIENEAERKKIAENGRNHVGQFTWDKAARQLEQVFYG